MEPFVLLPNDDGSMFVHSIDATCFATVETYADGFGRWHADVEMSTRDDDVALRLGARAIAAALSSRGASGQYWQTTVVVTDYSRTTTGHTYRVSEA